MTLQFGTDGVRGVANLEVTPELALALGRAAARVLGAAGPWAIGRDPRRSGSMLEAALAAGLAAEGAEVVSLGVVPTPAVAWWCAQRAAPGAVISASHNPFADNGIKLFAPAGRKLTDAVEAEIEALLAAPASAAPPTGRGVGVIGTDEDAARRYADWLVSTVGEGHLDGLRLVLDCGNGAASALAAGVFSRAGAEVVTINDHPDGTNINDRCGATHVEGLQRAVVEHRADAGLAFDGDADRLVAVDGHGAVVDGDRVIAVCAIDRHQRGALAGGAVAVTVMTNLGFHLGMRERGIRVVETPVGDRNVLDALDAGGLTLGGEQSGHVIFRDLATTGDGMLTGLQLLDVVARRGRSLAELAGEAMERLPQVLRNVRVAARVPGLEERLADDVAAARRRLGEQGRVLVRPSGTEPLIRVMVEATDHDLAESVAEDLVHAVERLVG